MAERRMFAKTIIDSDAFLDMPTSTQCLYFHLAMRADDDGFINNPKKIQRVVGSSDDDLKLLIAKKFIIPFESGIVVIKHWKIHNYIRADRKKDTVYTKEMELLTIKDNGSYTLNPEIPTLEDMSDNCQPDDNQTTAECQHRLGKDRLGKVSIDIYSPVIEYLNSKCNTKYRTTTKKTKDLISARVNEGFTLEDFKKVIDNKSAEWLGTEFEKFLRPETLFGTKFESYLNQKNIPKQQGKPNKFHNFIQSDDNQDLEAMARKRFEKLIQDKQKEDK